jgi:lipid-binding SYLF domain-containing protein
MTVTLLPSNAHAQNDAKNDSGAVHVSTTDSVSAAADEPEKRVADAVSVVRMMKADESIGDLIQRAKGLLIVPHFIKGALIFGGQSGAGLMVVQNNGRWSDPAFYKTSSGSFGAQIGGAKGALVMILTSDKAVEALAVKTSSWSLNAGAGLSTESYSKDTLQTGALSDVVVWSDTSGLFGGAAVGAGRIASDERANQAYYNRTDITPMEIFSGLVANPFSNTLRKMLPIQGGSQ